MHNLQTLVMMTAGVLMIYGAKKAYWSFLYWLAGFRHPQPATAPVVEWAYCICGDHMARSDHMAWYGGAFICDDCVRIQR